MPTKLGEWCSLSCAVVAALVILSAVGAAQPGQGRFPAFIPIVGSPEGVAVDRVGHVYVSVREGERGAIWKFTRDGYGARLANLGVGMIGGLAITPNGVLYATMAVGPDRGVYRIDRRGDAERLPGTDAIVFANALTFDPCGVLFVTESYSGSAPDYGQGSIWRIRPGRPAELWLREPLLTGLGYVLGYPVGANGVGYYHGGLYVVNTDKGFVVRVGVSPAGRPGVPEIWATIQDVPESPMAGSSFPVMGDGLALDVFGNLYVAVISRNAIVRILARDRTQETVAANTPNPVRQHAPFDTPASLAFGTGAGERRHLFVTNLGWMSTIVPGPPWPGPALVKIDGGRPGLPTR